MARKLVCPQCGEPAQLESKFFPFCSDRCKLIDLGKWASGEYAVPAIETSPEEEESQND